MGDHAFDHKMAAHCESGVVTALLNHAGLEISEAMVFGISGALFFGYFDSSTHAFPTFVLRNRPGRIRTKIARRLNMSFHVKTFRDPHLATQELDNMLAHGIPVGVQVDFFYMDYIPEYAKAHFNAHYIIVLENHGDSYLVSDSYSPEPALLKKNVLEEARFVKGPLAPKGLMFHVHKIPEHIDYTAAIRKGIKDVVFYMLRVPLPWIGVRGIRYFAQKLPTWIERAHDIEHLSHHVMMINVILEERGTGGGGFRFLYASFLQQAAKYLNDTRYEDVAKRMMLNGDSWRELSLYAARKGRNREVGREQLLELSEMLLAKAEEEKKIFQQLGQIV